MTLCKKRSIQIFTNHRPPPSPPPNQRVSLDAGGFTALVRAAIASIGLKDEMKCDQRINIRPAGTDPARQDRIPICRDETREKRARSIESIRRQSIGSKMALHTQIWSRYCGRTMTLRPCAQLGRQLVEAKC